MATRISNRIEKIYPPKYSIPLIPNQSHHFSSPLPTFSQTFMPLLTSQHILFAKSNPHYSMLTHLIPYSTYHNTKTIGTFPSFSTVYTKENTPLKQRPKPTQQKRKIHYVKKQHWHIQISQNQTEPIFPKSKNSIIEQPYSQSIT